MHVHCAAAIILLITVQLLISAVSAQDTPLVFKADRMKRFYSWEETKRSSNQDVQLPSDYTKRKFYAWAGKRSAPISDSVGYNKRKFYQWAGK